MGNQPTCKTNTKQKLQPSVLTFLYCHNPRPLESSRMSQGGSTGLSFSFSLQAVGRPYPHTGELFPLVSVSACVCRILVLTHTLLLRFVSCTRGGEGWWCRGRRPWHRMAGAQSLKHRWNDLTFQCRGNTAGEHTWASAHWAKPTMAVPTVWGGSVSPRPSWKDPAEFTGSHDTLVNT